MREVVLISTGGTIEKTYDERSGVLENRASIVHRMLRRLRLEETDVRHVELLSKDSLDLDDHDRTRIVEAVRLHGETAAGVVVLHGTDTLQTTGEKLWSEIGTQLGRPIVLVGAMRPYEMTRSDALQNLTEAIFATGVLPPGVYCVAHGRALAFPGVVKDRDRQTFVKR